MAQLLHLLSVISGLIPSWIGARVRGVLWYYALLSFLCDTLGYLYLWGYASPPTGLGRYWFGNLFLTGEFLLLGGYFTQEVFAATSRKWVAIVALIIAASFIVYVSGTGFLDLNLKGGAYLYGVMIPMTILGFYTLLRSKQPSRLEQSPLFIFLAGYLLYVSGIFVIFLFKGVLEREDTDLLKALWFYVHNILNILNHLTIAYALHLYGKQAPPRAWLRK